MALNRFFGINLPTLGGLGPRTAKQYPKTLTKDNLIATDTLVLATGKWNRIGSYSVPPQQIIQLGQGDPRFPANQGYIYIYLKDNSATPVEVTGKVRLMISDANEVNYQVIFEEREEVLHGDISDKNKMKAFPLDPRQAKEDDKIILEVYPDSALTLNKANSTVLVPATVTVTG